MIILKYLYWTIKHVLATVKHKWFVFVAGKIIMPKNHKVSMYRLIVHDWSKFSISEAPHYGRNFFGDKERKDLFHRAWLHHANSNPHHWQYWVLQKDIIVPMPKKFIREMVADWLGAEKSYGKSWDMSAWLIKNLGKVEIEDSSKEYLYHILIALGYENVIKRVIIKEKLQNEEVLSRN